MKKAHKIISGIAVTAAVFALPLVAGENASAENTTLRVNVGEVISITAPDTVSMSTSGSTTGTFVRQSAAVIVNTNAVAGYTLSISSASSNTYMSSTTSSTKITSTFSGTKTSSNMSDNTWGYSTNGTNYSKIPAASAPTTIKTTSAASVDSTSSTTVYFGVKPAVLLPAGVYTSTIRFTATAN